MLAKRARVFFSVSVLILIIAILMAVWGIPKLINKKIKEAVTIDNSSQMFDKWVKMPIPLDFKVYLFNVTNAEDITTGAKPILAEVGPYVYKEYREKTNITYGANDTVKYMLKKTFEFDSERSGTLSDEDELTVIYFPYLAALTSVQMMLPSMLGTLNEALKEFFPNVVDPFMRVKVKDLLFDGVYLDCSGNHSALGLICMQVKAEKNPTMRPAEEGSNGFYFSLFSHMNRTEAGPYEISRGIDNIADLGHINTYNGKKSSNSWSNKYCGMINGTDSTIFPPILDGKPPMRIYNFEPDICRSMYASYVGTKTMFDLSSYYYEISSSALAAYSAEPDNKCFCKRNWSSKHDGCLVMGVMSLYPCQGAPAIISLPHFYLGSDELLDYFQDGISPNKTLHNTYLYLESTTSVVLKGVKRLQFNIELRQMADVPELAEVQTGLFPLLWIEEGAELTPSLLEEIRSSHSLLQIVEGVRWTLLLIGIVLTIISAVFVIHGSSVSVWPRNSNSVNFILQHGDRKNVS